MGSREILKLRDSIWECLRCFEIYQTVPRHRLGGGGGFPKTVATFSNFNLFMDTTGGVWVTPSSLIWGYVLHVELISCVITNCGQQQWAIPYPLLIDLGLLEENVARKLLSLSLDLFFKIFLFHVAFLIFFFHRYLFSLLSSGWFVLAVCGFISARELVTVKSLI